MPQLMHVPANERMALIPLSRLAWHARLSAVRSGTAGVRQKTAFSGLDKQYKLLLGRLDGSVLRTYAAHEQTAGTPSSSITHDASDKMATIPGRNPDVTDGVWDSADQRAVDQALKDAAKISRLGQKYGCGEVLLGQKLEHLEALAIEDGQQKYRAKQICDAIYRKGVRRIDEISNIPKTWKETLIEKRAMTVGRSRIHHQVVAEDGTRKFLLKLHDGFVVETVGIPADGSHRLTVCVSSQVGCPMRCTFCATGKGGFARNLMPHEIVDQVLTVQEEFGQRVSNVVFMGMGEPLLNIPSVMRAHEIINKELQIGARHITVSTVGVPNAIMKLAEYDTQSTLAISIHAPNQKLREQIVPSAKAYPLTALMNDCSNYFEATGRRVTFEYTLLAGVNDSIQDAQALAALLRKHGNMRSHVNVIPWNPVDDSEFKRPSRNGVRRFVQVLESAGIKSSIRITRGLEAAAACGQLRNRHQTEPLTT